MDYQAIILGMSSKYPFILTVLAIAGSLVAITTLIVQLTPTKSDDAVLEKIESSTVWSPLIKLLMSFSLIQKK